MSMVTWRAKTLVVVTCALSGALMAVPTRLAAQPSRPGASQAAAPRMIYSVRDVVGWSLRSELEELREGNGTNKVEPAVSTRAQAMATARQIATRRSSPALRAFIDTTTWSPNQLRKLSAYAAMNGGEGAMALLLAAERRKPGDWATQYNIAMYLQLEGYPRASLAILDSLRAPAGARGPGGVDLRAALLLGRGNGMLAQGRARAAIPLLREARQLEPAMSEAARSLARAHLMLDEEEEAKRALFLARRFATKAQMDAVVIIDPIRSDDEDINIEAIEDGRPLRLNQRWPFRKGYAAALPMMEPPSSPEGIKPFLQALEPRLNEVNAQFSSALSAAQTAAQAYATDTVQWAFPALRSQLHADANLPWGLMPASFAFMCAATEGVSTSAERFNQEAANRAANDRFEDERVQNPQLAGYTRTLRRAAASACGRLDSKFWIETNELLGRLTDRCPSGPEYRRCVCKAQREVAGLQLNTVNEVLQPYHTAARQWYRVAHDQSTSTAGYVEKNDKTLRKMLGAEIDVHKTMTIAGVHQNMQVQYQVITALCVPEKPEVPDSVLGDFELQPFDPSDACSAADGMGIKQDFVVAEVKLSCYEIEVEGKAPLAVPGFNAIGSVTFTFGGPKEGNITIFTGVGIGTPEGFPVELGAKAGSYVTFKNGTLTDGGFKVSAEATEMHVVKEVSEEISAKEAVLELAGSAKYVSNEFLMLLSP